MEQDLQEPAAESLVEKVLSALEDFVPEAVTWITAKIPKTLLLLAGIWVAFRLARLFVARLERLLERKAADAGEAQRIRTLTGIVHQVLRIAIGVGGGFMILANLEVQLGPILAAAGIGGLAIGFGAQNLVKDLVTGFFVLLENQIRVGDVIQVAGVGGLVEAVGIRTLRLRDLSGNVHILPHGAIDKVMNQTKDYSMYLFEIGVAYREDPDEVVRVVNRLEEAMRREAPWGEDILEPLETIGVDRFEDSAVVLRFRFKTRPGRQWAVGREMNRRIWKTFNEVGIEIPFPHRTLYFGEPKKGTAPPAQVRLVETGTPP
jgi:small conductance mechanosensitive channel